MCPFVFLIAVIHMQNESDIAYQPQGGFPRTINERSQDTECCIDMYSSVIDKSQSSGPMGRGKKNQCGVLSHLIVMDNWFENIVLDVETEVGDTMCPKSHSKSPVRLRADLRCFVVTELQQQIVGASKACNVCAGIQTSHG